MRITMIPYGVLSYLLGLTHVGFRQYLTGSLAVMIHIIIWLYVGSTLTCLDSLGGSNSKPLVEYIALIIQTVVALGIGIYISIIAKKELDKRLLVAEEHELTPLKTINID